ncbi:MAG: thiamine diphosphokinase, partial [Desulfitobacterium hafniense]|nr:thiamine diphosphokinase [Desulfitobacterium hafniense]
WGRRELQDVTFLVCADGGGNSALTSGRLPDVLIGDLDSIDPGNLESCLSAGVKVMRFPREKDETDLELALAFAVEHLKDSCSEEDVGKREIWLYGATGGRIDHLLGNISLMIGYAQRGWRIRLIDPVHTIWIISGMETVAGAKDQEISLLALSEKAVVSLEGFYYPLVEETLYQNIPRGISNVFLGNAGTVTVHEGLVLAVRLSQKT